MCQKITRCSRCRAHYGTGQSLNDSCNDMHWDLSDPVILSKKKKKLKEKLYDPIFF